MRVFDLMGVVEAVGEIREELEGKSEECVGMRDGGELEEPERVGKEEVKGVMKSTIADSEDEDEEDDMLFDAPGAITDSGKRAIDVQPTDLQSKTEGPADRVSEKHTLEVRASTDNVVEKTTKTTFILLDNLANLVSPLQKKDYVQGTQSLSYPLSSYPLSSYLFRFRRPKDQPNQ
jgi:hypothetical protein